MKIGDLVAFKINPLHPKICECKGCLGEKGLILDIDNSRRQESLALLSSSGTIIKGVWVNHVEVTSENR